MSAATKDHRGRVVLTSVHPEWGTQPSDAPGPHQDAFLKHLVDHAAGRGDDPVGKTTKRLLVLAQGTSPTYQAQLRAALGRTVERPSQVEILSSPAALASLKIGSRPKDVVLVIPGGNAVLKWEDEGLRKTAKKLTDALRGGAGFLGICAGAYIGSAWWAADAAPTPAPPASARATYLAAAADVYALGWAHRGGRMNAAAAVGVSTGLGHLSLALYDGPLLAAGAHSRVLARFDDPAIATVDTAGTNLTLAAATVSDTRL